MGSPIWGIFLSYRYDTQDSGGVPVVVEDASQLNNQLVTDVAPLVVDATTSVAVPIDPAGVPHSDGPPVASETPSPVLAMDDSQVVDNPPPVGHDNDTSRPIPAVSPTLAGGKRHRSGKAKAFGRSKSRSPLRKDSRRDSSALDDVSSLASSSDESEDLSFDSDLHFSLHSQVLIPENVPLPIEQEHDNLDLVTDNALMDSPLTPITPNLPHSQPGSQPASEPEVSQASEETMFIHSIFKDDSAGLFGKGSTERI